MKINQQLQRGFTLVELLVGLVLTLFISAIAITYMVASSQSFRVQANDSLSQENARYALEILSQNVRLAGFDPLNNIGTNLDVIYTGTGCEAAEQGQNSGTEICTQDGLTANANGINSDRFAVEYIVDGNFTACNGALINASPVNTQRLANVFWTADIDLDGVRSLYCQTINVNGGNNVGGAPAQPIIDGVDAIQVQYGVAENPDGLIQSYQSYDNLIAGGLVAQTRNVKAIRIALLVNGGFASAGDSQLEVTQDRTYQLLDATVSVNADRLLRQVYSTTIATPNNF